MTFSFAPEVLRQPGNAAVWDFTLSGGTDGAATSAAPYPYPVRLLQTVLRWNGSTYDYEFDSTGNLVSDDVVAPGPEGAWSGYSAGSSGSLDACRPNCTYVLNAEIQDPVRGNDGTRCEEYEPASLCVSWIYYEATRQAPMNSTCEDGEGVFGFVPRRILNRDEDTDLSASLFPVMLSGTGQLTNAAWLTEIEMLTTQGQVMRAIKSNAAFRFDENDLLVDPAFVSRVLSTTPTTFNPGVLSGRAPFVLEEVPETMPLSLTARMEWTCAPLQPHEDIVAPPGYTFELGDLGCAVDWPQRFTIRAEPTLLPTHLSFEVYGGVADKKRTLLTQTPAGKAFRYAISALTVEGTLLSASPNAGAVVDLTEVSWAGVPICTPGVYTLPGEE